MPKLLVAYVSTAVVFLLLDGGWLVLAGPTLYRPELGSMLADKVRLPPALVFYLMYVGGLIYFAVNPALSTGWTKALVAGAVLGLLAYGTYDLTCAATMRDWSAKVTVADMIWGAVASGLASAAGTAITRKISGA